MADPTDQAFLLLRAGHASLPLRLHTGGRVVAQHAFLRWQTSTGVSGGEPLIVLEDGRTRARLTFVRVPPGPWQTVPAHAGEPPSILLPLSPSILPFESMISSFAHVDVRQPDRPDEAIDAVYTWVDGSDPDWQHRYRTWIGREEAPAEGRCRHRDNQELRYSLRALATNAPWIRRVYIVTDGQVPDWLAPAASGLEILPHEALFPDASHLPTFNSNAIEMHLHRIPGLSRRYLYLNDDLFIARPLGPQAWLESDDRVAIHLEQLPLPRVREGSRRDLSLTTTQNLFDERLGHQVARWMPAHVPQLYDRTRVAEVAERFADTWRRTSAQRFRNPRGLVLAVAYAYHVLENSSGPSLHTPRWLQRGSEAYAWHCLESADDAEQEAMRSLVRNRPALFCINDDLPDAADGRIITDTLESMFPEPSRFER